MNIARIIIYIKNNLQFFHTYEQVEYLYFKLNSKVPKKNCDQVLSSIAEKYTIPILVTGRHKRLYQVLLQIVQRDCVFVNHGNWCCEKPQSIQKASVPHNSKIFCFAPGAASSSTASLYNVLHTTYSADILWALETIKGKEGGKVPFLQVNLI